MFKSARLKLTAWYLLIIMVISICFSIFIYYNLSRELDRNYRRSMDRRLIYTLDPIDTDLINESKGRLELTLIYLNLLILLVSAGAGYFLAGRTLKPIQTMLEEQDRFITDASHELRTPLTALRSEIEVNLRSKELTLKESKKLLESNLEEVVNLQTLSDNLLKLTQYQTNKTQVTIEKLQLPEVITSAVKKMSALAERKNIKVKSEVPNLEIMGNKPMLIEMLVIFIDNAIKYSPEKTQIKINAKKTDNHVLISISDQGQGIKDEAIPHLFDRFYRADESRSKSSTDGYGLGLSIAQKIAEIHKAHLELKSQVGKGTTVTVNLPLS